MSWAHRSMSSAGPGMPTVDDMSCAAHDPRETVHAPSLRRFRDTASDLRHGDLSVLDLYEVNVRHALSALLTRRSILLEFDRAVEAENIDFPQGSANRLRVRLAGNLDGFGNSPNPVIASKARRQTAEGKASLIPLVDKSPRGFRVRCCVGRPRVRRKRDARCPQLPCRHS